MTPADDPSVGAVQLWNHQILLDGDASRHTARSFVSGQLLSHEIFHLVAPASVVAAILTRDVMLRGGGRLRLTLTRIEELVRLTVDGLSDDGRATERTTLLDGPPGQGIVGLLSLDWGVTEATRRVEGLWAVFDARDRRPAGSRPPTTVTSTRGPPSRSRGRPC
jgi:hypothetical protein